MVLALNNNWPALSGGFNFGQLSIYAYNNEANKLLNMNTFEEDLKVTASIFTIHAPPNSL